MSDLVDVSAAVLEVDDAGYERWRVRTHGVDALAERWPGQPELATRALSAGGWLRERLGGPKVLAQQGDAVLLELPEGMPASVPVAGLHRSLRALGAALTELHRLDPAGLERLLSLDDLLAEATGRIERDELSSASFRPAYRRYRPERLLELATASFPGDARSGELVVTHGWPSLTNLFVAGETRTGWLRLDGLAVADRHRDLARVTKQLAEQFGGEAITVFFDAYGTVPDVRRLDAYALLDELLP
jgi:aminoglycoside phosphotransferase